MYMYVCYQNEQVSFEIALPTDFWFHASGVPGGHILLRCHNSSTTLLERDVQFAADIAAYFSKSRHERNVKITFTKAINVHRIPGAPPGKVHVARCKEIVGRPFDVKKLVEDILKGRRDRQLKPDRSNSSERDMN